MVRLAVQKQNIARLEVLDGTDTLQNLISDWNDSERSLANIFAQEAAGAVSHQTDPAFRDRLGERLREVEEKQFAILERIHEFQSHSLSQVLEKLKVWRSIACPSLDFADCEAPADRLILNAISELEGLVALEQVSAPD